VKTGMKEVAYKTVKKFFSTRNLKSEAIENRKGKIIDKHEHIAKRWKEYLKAL